MGRVELVELEYPDGEIGYAEVAVPHGGDTGGWRSRYSLAQLAPEIQRTSRWLMDEVAGALPGTPAKVGLEFGLKLHVKNGRLIGALAEVGGEATMVIKLEWNPGAGASQ